MLTYQNDVALISKPAKKLVVSRNSKKAPPHSSPVNSSFPYYYPPQISPNFPKVYPPIIEPPKPIYPKFN
jgi:hypothetical protein